MKLYSNLDVDMTYQNFGSAWLGILRGPTEQIELTFNGLFNFCATNGQHEFQDHLEIVTTFWTDRRAMLRFFFNRFFIPRCEGNSVVKQLKLARKAMRYAYGQMEALTANSHENYLDFSNAYVPETYGNGCISAERPDADMKDAILANAFAEKDTVSHKTVDTDGKL